MKKKVSLVKKHHLIYDWLTFVLTRDMQSWSILENFLSQNRLPEGQTLIACHATTLVLEDKIMSI